jgi:virginiamycin B lyase
MRFACRIKYTAGVLALLTVAISSSFAAAAPALTGTVSSKEEGKMEGVLVSARRVGSIITTTVVTDSRGHYEFPGGRLEPGTYHLKIRAVGYDLVDPGSVEVRTGKAAEVNLTLVKTKDLASQLTNAEWFLSQPQIKEKLLDNYKYGVNCIGCHPLSVVVKSKYKAEQWPPILINRMWQYSEASIYEPGQVRIPDKLPEPVPAKAGVEDLAKFLASINLSSSADGKWPFELKTLPRVKGRSTREIVTEWDLPRRAAQPHDAAVAPDGMVWYSDVGNAYIGRLNPKTGEIKEWQVPKRDPARTMGTFDIKFDQEGNPFFGLAHQEGIAKFDRSTEKFTEWWDVAGGMIAIRPDGKVWSKDQAHFKVHLLDPRTGEVKMYPMLSGNRFYGIESDSRGNFYGASLQLSVIGELLADTGKWTLYPTPTQNAGPRRADFDSQDHFWFAEYYAGKIGMFDTKTKQFQEWDIPPTPWSGPYDVVVDQHGEVWAGGEYADNVYRLNPKTGEVTTYPLPTLEMNIQRMDVDRSANPVTVWAGENHQAKIARVEPLD